MIDRAEDYDFFGKFKFFNTIYEKRYNPVIVKEYPFSRTCQTPSESRIRASFGISPQFFYVN